VNTYVVPFEKKFLIYRPLIHAAFLGNRAMAETAQRYTNNKQKKVRLKDGDAYKFLERVGFLQPDPPLPATPELQYEPQSVVLLMTNRCNLRCSYCYAAAGEKPQEDMPLNLAIQAVDIAASNARKAQMPSFDLVFHGGGEPTQHWNVMTQTIQYARSKPIKSNISVSSNGVWSEKQRNFLLENLDGLSLSFDGIREVQDSQRPTVGGGSSFATVMKTIEELDKEKFAYNIRLTWTLAQAKSFAESVRFIYTQTGCRKIQVEPAFNPGRTGWKNPNPKEADLFITTFKEGLDIAKSHHADLMYAGARPWMTVCSFCTAAEQALVVRPDGKLVACYEITDSRHPLADFFTIGRLGENGPIFFPYALKRLSDMRHDRLALCKDCFCVWHCGGDCSSRCFSADGTGHLRFEERCRINREISKEILAQYIVNSGGVWRGNINHAQQREMREDTFCDACKRKNSGRCGNKTQRAGFTFSRSSS
jgi:uncharacterized protein